MASLLHISTTATSSFIRDCHIDFTHLFVVYVSVGDPNDSDYQILRRCAMAQAMFSHFFFQTSSEIFITIVCGLKVMMNALMLELVGTLMGLD